MNKDALNEPQYDWGGEWTIRKLDAFEKYVKSYLTIMNKYRDKYDWQLIYFDGFAGSGCRNELEKQSEVSRYKDLFEEVITKDDISYKGSAERVLSIDTRGFDFYYFIDIDKNSNESLQIKLNSKYQGTSKLVFRGDDANNQIRLLSDSMLKNPRLKALVLLDPFGMQINWQSIESLGRVNGIDLWILIPTGVIVNRLLERDGSLSHIEKLKLFFGLDENTIRDYFYETLTDLSLFEGKIDVIKKKSKPIHRIAELYIDRLKTLYSHVTSKPLVLANSNNVPIFHFVFASNNETAAKIAQQIIVKI